MGNVPVATVKTMRTKGDSFETAKNNAKKVFFFLFFKGRQNYGTRSAEFGGFPRHTNI